MNRVAVCIGTLCLVGCASHGGAERKRLAMHREPPVANVTDSDSQLSSDDARRRGEQIATSLHAISAVVDALSDDPSRISPEETDETSEPVRPDDGKTK
jgi:uncharacterized protein YcfL